MSDKMNDKIDETIKAIRGTYGDKYHENDFEQFRVYARANAKNIKQLVNMVENMFDLDTADARDMVS